MIIEMKKRLCINDYSLLAIKDDFEYYSFESGIKPVMLPMRKDKNFFKDCLVVDKTIGKASASLLVLSGVKEIYALLMSKSAEEVLKKYNIPYHYDKLVDYIVNNTGDDMCPMEKTVKDIDDLEESFIALDEKLRSLMGK